MRTLIAIALLIPACGLFSSRRETVELPLYFETVEDMDRWLQRHARVRVREPETYNQRLGQAIGGQWTPPPPPEL